MQLFAVHTAPGPLKIMLAPEAAAYDPGGAGVNDIALSPDGKIVAVGDSDGDVYLWEATDGGLSRTDTLQAAIGGGINGVAFSPDGKIVAAGDSGGSIRLWDVATGRSIGSPLNAGPAVNAVAFSPDGKIVAAGDSGGSIRLWDVATGQPVTAYDGGYGIDGLAFSSSGMTLAVGDSGGVIQLLSLSTPQPAAIITCPFIADANGINIRFSPDGPATGNKLNEGGVFIANEIYDAFPGGQRWIGGWYSKDPEWIGWVGQKYLHESGPSSCIRGLAVKQ